MEKTDTPWAHFMASEFHNAVPSCDPLQMDDGFMKTIELVRTRSGVPFVINSAYRTRSWDKAHGRSGDSFHCVGQALDIACIDSSSRYKIIEAAMFFGLGGIGIADTFIHLDNRPSAKIWLYDSRSGIIESDQVPFMDDQLKVY